MRKWSLWLEECCRKLRRRPAVAAATLFICGIVLHSWVPAWGCAWGILGLALIGLAAILFRRVRVSSILLAGGLLFCGIAAAQVEAFYFAVDDIGLFATDEPRLARVELLIDEPLRILNNAFSPGARPMPPREVTTARIVRVLTNDGWKPASGRALVQIDPPNPSVAMGQTVRFLAMLQRPSPAMNPGQFDWASYYREQRILASITITHGGAFEIVDRGSPSLLARVRQSVRSALARGFSKSQSLDHALLAALVLGDNDPELRDVQEAFRKTGTSHHLAISGMHVAILGGLIYWLLRRLMIRPRWITLIAMGFVVLYGAIALPSPPVIRSVILCAAVGLGLIMWRSIDSIQLLALSVLALLAWHPLDLYSAGFQLSFGTVLGLMILTRRVMPLTRDEDAEVALSTPGGRPPWRLRASHRLRQWFLPPLVFGIVAWVVSMPLIAFHFEQLNPWAVIASLLLAIPVFLALTAGFLKILLTLTLPFGAHWWATLAAIPVSWMRHGVDWLAMMPGSDVPLPAHSILFIFVYYALLLLPLAPIAWPRMRTMARWSPVLAVMLLVMIPLTGGATSAPRGTLRVNVLAVGAGQCCVIEMPDGRVILVDAGSATLNDPVHKCITPFLRDRGISNIDEIWLADCDYDHICAAAELIRVYHVPRVVFSTRFEHDASNKPADENLFEQIRASGVSVRRYSRADHVEIEKGVSFDVLWPPVSGSARLTNDDDLVLKLTYARRTILFPSDIQQSAQATLLRDHAPLHCDAMLAPHHGSGESTTPAFLAAADPLFIVSSNDRTLTQKQRLFERQTGNRPLYRTNRVGATTIIIDRNGGLNVTPYLIADQQP